MPLLGCKGARKRPSGAATATSASASASDDGAANSTYELRVGPALSPTDPKLSDFKDTLPVGYIGMRFETLEPRFTIQKIEVSLFKLTLAGRQIETKKVSALGPSDNVFHKSWEVTAPGNYEVRVVDPATDRLLASRVFNVLPKR